MTNHDDFRGLDAIAQAELVRTGRATPLELVDAAIERIARVNPTLNAIIHPRFEQARAEAQGILPNGPLRGVPIVVKDLDGSTTNDPRHLGNRRLKELGVTVDHDSELVARLRRAGCIVVGKTNTPEFGLVPTTEPIAYGATHNPWDLDRSPGGSSGGSAAAIASGMVPLAHGGDGGGSLRIPASACGIFGLKPTRGRVTLGPDDGEVWGGYVVRGVMSRTVRDSALALDVIAGPGVGDPYWAPEPQDAYSRSSLAAPAPLRIGYRTTVGGGLADVDPACVAAVEDAAALCESLGHEVLEASPAALDDPALVGAFITVLSVWTARECDHLAALLGRDVRADDVEPITWFYAELGRMTTATAYVEALCALQAWTRDMASWWADDFDLLLTPTMAEPPARLGDMVADPADPGPAIARTIPFAAFTAPFNVTGQPAMSVPLFVSNGLPIGTQFAAAAGREDVLLALATQLEHERPWADRTPPVFA
ncbi:MAG: amidase [Acidimicrobiia bacterium]